MTNSHNSLVSICIPTFNGEMYLEDALNSVINQTYRPLEIVISDDHSTDKTLLIIHQVTSKSNIPIIIINHNPEGIGANWNNCILNSSGKYIKFLFQDDLLCADCVEKMVDFAEKEGEDLGLVFCERELIGDVKNISEKISNRFKFERIQNGKILLNNRNLFTQPRNKIGEPTSVLLRKSVFSNVGYFNVKLKQSLDYEFWYRVCRQYNIGYLNATLAKFRIHDGQTSKKIGKSA